MSPRLNARWNARIPAGRLGHPGRRVAGRRRRERDTRLEPEPHEGRHELFDREPFEPVQASLARAWSRATRGSPSRPAPSSGRALCIAAVLSQLRSLRFSLRPMAFRPRMAIIRSLSRAAVVSFLTVCARLSLERANRIRRYRGSCSSRGELPQQISAGRAKRWIVRAGQTSGSGGTQNAKSRADRRRVKLRVRPSTTCRIRNVGPRVVAAAHGNLSASSCS
jgi:hypothetical protein